MDTHITSPIVIRLSPDVENGVNFEDYGAKIGFEPIRIGNIQRLLVFLATIVDQPTLVMMDEGFIEDLGPEAGDFISMLRTMVSTRFSQKQLKVAILIAEPIEKSTARKWKDIGISGVVPRVSKFNYALAYQAFEALIKDSGEFWHKDCIKVGVSVKKKDNSGESITLTDRQQEVQQLLCERGLSNKAIARLLNISESTVKIHVSAILKRYGVRNRTQLALAVNNGARL